MAKKAFQTGRRMVHDVHGIRGLAIRFNLIGAEQLKIAIATLPEAVQKKHLRAAVRAAAGPVAKDMRRGARQASASSRWKAGIGTTARSIAIKVGTSKRDPAVAYALIGARRGYRETVVLKPDNSIKRVRKPGKIRRITTRAGNTRYLGVQYRDIKNLGPIARKARLNPKSNSSLKRTPSRYLHLIEKGTRRSRAYRFMQAAVDSQQAAAQEKFAEILGAGIVKEFKSRAP